MRCLRWQTFANDDFYQNNEECVYEDLDKSAFWLFLFWNYRVVAVVFIL
jgi:hypothetical protein